MPKRTLAKIITMALTAGVLASCGSSVKPKPATGSLITIVQDAPICNAISATLTITGLNFSPVGGGANASYLTTTSSYAPSIRLNLQQLRDFDTFFYIFNVAGGRYNQANFLVELSQVATYEPTLTPPVKLLTTTLTQAKPTVTLSTPLVITPGQANVLLLDFDVLHMLQTGANGQLTGAVTPVITATPLVAPTNGSPYAEFDDLSGFVRSVTLTNTTVNPLYTGSFLMQLLSPSVSGAPAIAVNLSANSNLVGFTDLSHLLPDSYMEVDATLDSQGNLAGNTVEFQALAQPYTTSTSPTPHTALIGPIVSIATDQAGNPTQFDLWVRDAEPMDSTRITLDSIFQVNLTSATTFQISALGPNFANLGFGPRNLAVGQEVVVHGAYTGVPGPTGSKSNLLVTVDPSAIFLKLQSLQGSLSSIVQVGSDNLTGAFVLGPCCTLLQGAPIYVLTNNQTTFLNSNGLGGLTPQDVLLVKGMPFFEPQAGTINGVPIPAGTLVVQAKQVHRLQM